MRLVIEYIFIINLFRDININTIYYKPCQSLANITGTFSIITFFYGVSTISIHFGASYIATIGYCYEDS
jgi:hypothetical protein